MKLCVYAIWDDGGASYYIQDLETALGVVDIAFTTESAAQVYLDTHREEIERKGLPPPSPEDVELYWKAVELVEKKQLKEIGSMRTAKRFLLHLAGQSTPPDEPSLRRIESAIASLDIMATNARAEETKTVLNIVLSAPEAESRLDLARAYFEMGDKEGALEFLSEVVRQGGEEYKDRARKMIAEISGQAS